MLNHKESAEKEHYLKKNPKNNKLNFKVFFRHNDVKYTVIYNHLYQYILAFLCLWSQNMCILSSFQGLDG